jgi:D-alanyl-D-alanine carboxypeptidase (penicillin-binding protein 5/6)
VLAAVVPLIALAPTPPAPASAYVACPTVRVAEPALPIAGTPAHSPVVGGAGLGTTGLVVPAGTPPLPSDISARFWVVADLDTGAVLATCGPHEYSAPASVQKLLLVATVMPKLDPSTVVTVTADDLNVEPDSSLVGLVRNGQYTVEDLWRGLLLESGNDAANVLARLGGGVRGVPGALADMNSEARHLGAFDTHVVTPSGLDGSGQVTSAYDLALIARADFARTDFSRYTATRTATMPAQSGHPGFQIQNDNSLLYNYPGAIGGKTGFTDVAQHTYVGAAERGGRRLVVTMLYGEHQPLPMWQQGASLLDWGFAIPHGTSVGQLVSAGTFDPPPSTSPSVTPVASVAAAAAAGGSSFGKLWLVAGFLSLAAFVAFALSRRWRAD